jgi:hypothetical protein
MDVQTVSISLSGRALQETTQAHNNLISKSQPLRTGFALITIYAFGLFVGEIHSTDTNLSFTISPIQL